MKKLLSATAMVLLFAILLLSVTSASAREDAFFPAASAADITVRGQDPLHGDGLVVAVIDAGFQTGHEVFALPEEATPALSAADLFPKLLTSRAALLHKLGPDVLSKTYISEKIPFAFDYMSGDTLVSGGSASHGTHVASLIAGYSDTQWGVVPAAQLLLMKVFDDRGVAGDETVIAAAVLDAVAFGADVINMSLGALSASAADPAMPYLARALEEAENAGVIVVCAAGNNGSTGKGGALSDTMSVLYPDTGLPAEPAAFPTAFGVGAGENGFTAETGFWLGETFLAYADTLEVAEGLLPPFREQIGGKDYEYVPVPGFGRPGDYAGLSLTDKIALVARGEISFAEKAAAAADAGALALVVWDEEGSDGLYMRLERTVLPTVSVSYSAGRTLLAAEERTLYVPDTITVTGAGKGGVADFSSGGPTADMALPVDILAPGTHVNAAVRQGGYDALSGTSMAAPQIAGLSALYLYEHREALSALDKSQWPQAVRTALSTAAVPLTEKTTGLPLSPRIQGAGMLTALPTTAVTVTGAGGETLAHLGDHLPGEGGSVSFQIRIQNGGDTRRVCKLSAVVITEDYRAKDGRYYVTGTPRLLPSDVAFSEETVTLAPGAYKDVTVTVTPEPSALTALSAVFKNGFYLEGYVYLAEEGEDLASIPFFGFCGDWSAAPLIDAFDFDGGESYYGAQAPYLSRDGEPYRTLNGDSDTFAISPDGDGVGDVLHLRLFPLRHIRHLSAEIVNAAGETVAETSFGRQMKARFENGTLRHTDVTLWDGTDGLNAHYTLPDGAYTVRLKAVSYLDTEEVWEFPLRIDRTAPLVSWTLTGRTLTVTAEDGTGLTSLAVFTPEKVPVFTPSTPAYVRSLRYRIPADADVVYVRAEDAAGNVTYLRYYTEDLYKMQGTNGKEMAG